MIVALAQTNALIGDYEGNANRILELARRAMDPASGLPAPDLLVFPEMALCGYPPLDLLDQPSFAEGSLAALRRLQRELPRGLAVALGYVDRNRSGSGRPLRNAVAVIRDGAIVFTQAKTLLPTYDVFDEARYFEPAVERRVFELAGCRIGFAICEDIWWEAPPHPGHRYALDPVKELLDAGAELLVVPSASPFHAGKLELRARLAADAAREGGVPVLYCNLVGANDSLVFDGRSFALDAAGKPAALGGWEEGLLFVALEDGVAVAEGSPRSRSRTSLRALGFLSADSATPGASRDGTALAEAAGALMAPSEAARWDEIERALVLGIRDYLRKCGFRRACLGLSGGIDSALIAVLAAEAIGAENVVCLSMPSRFSSEGSVSDSVELCRRLGMRLESLPIEGPFEAYLKLLEPHFQGRPFDLTEENLQARVRGAILMAWSNKFDALLLTTGNKSELAVGYCTLYGDMCGALAPIGDLLKTEVYGLCRAINARCIAEGREAPIPLPIIDKAPSAELRPNQTDQDSLPPYELLDAILRRHIEGNLALEDLVAQGFDPPVASRVISLVARSEYKRRQAAPVIKVSPRAFGIGRRIPIARAIHELRRP